MCTVSAGVLSARAACAACCIALTHAAPPTWPETRSPTVHPSSPLSTSQLHTHRSSSGASAQFQPRTPGRLARIIEVHSPDSSPCVSCTVELIEAEDAPSAPVAGRSGAPPQSRAEAGNSPPSPKRRRIVVRCENVVKDPLGENLRTFDKALGDLAQNAVWALEEIGISVDEWRADLRAKSFKIGFAQYP